MKLITTILIFILATSSLLFAEVEKNRPNMVITNEAGEVIEGLTTSITEMNAFAKVLNLPDGTYLLKRPDVTFTVKNNLPIPEGAIAFTSSFTVDTEDGHVVVYNWKQVSGIDVPLLPTEGEMTFTFGFELPKGMKFNVLAVEEK